MSSSVVQPTNLLIGLDIIVEIYKDKEEAFGRIVMINPDCTVTILLEDGTFVSSSLLDCRLATRTLTGVFKATE